MKLNRTSTQYYNKKYMRNHAIQEIGKDDLKTDINIKAQQEQGPRLHGAF